MKVSDLGILATNYGTVPSTHSVPEPSVFFGIFYIAMVGLAFHRKLTRRAVLPGPRLQGRKQSSVQLMLAENWQMQTGATWAKGDFQYRRVAFADEMLASKSAGSHLLTRKPNMK